MMKKLIIFLMAVLLPLSAFEMSADEKEHTYEYMTNFSSSGEVAGDVLKIGWSVGASETVKRTVKHTESYKQEDDELGNFVVQYSDKIILSQSSTSATIKTYTTGYVDAMIIPRYE